MAIGTTIVILILLFVAVLMVGNYYTSGEFGQGVVTGGSPGCFCVKWSCGSTTTTSPPTSTTVHPTPGCKANGLACSYNSQCCSNYCYWGKCYGTTTTTTPSSNCCCAFPGGGRSCMSQSSCTSSNGGCSGPCPCGVSSITTTTIRTTTTTPTKCCCYSSSGALLCTTSCQYDCSSKPCSVQSDCYTTTTPTTIPSSCSKTDSNEVSTIMRLMTVGTCTDSKGKTYTDECVSSDRLKEYRCSGANCVWTQYFCSTECYKSYGYLGSCSNGACVCK